MGGQDLILQPLSSVLVHIPQEGQDVHLDKCY